MEKENKISPTQDEAKGQKVTNLEEKESVGLENLLQEASEDEEDRPQIKDFRKFIGCGG